MYNKFPYNMRVFKLYVNTYHKPIRLLISRLGCSWRRWVYLPPSQPAAESSDSEIARLVVLCWGSLPLLISAAMQSRHFTRSLAKIFKRSFHATKICKHLINSSHSQQDDEDNKYVSLGGFFLFLRKENQKHRAPIFLPLKLLFRLNDNCVFAEEHGIDDTR